MAVDYNALYAFLASFGAGFSTMLGTVVLFLNKVKQKNYSFLGYSNAFAGGVMLIVSMCEILQVKAVEGFRDYFCKEYNEDCHGKVYGKTLALSYFLFHLGILFSYGLNYLVHFISDDETHGNCHDLENCQEDVENPKEDVKIDTTKNPKEDVKIDTTKNPKEDVKIDTTKNPEEDVKIDPKKILVTGFTSMAAITLHNLPEGIVSYISVYNDFGSGIVLSLAIAAHNIPEGLAIAIPIYYATKSKKKALFYVFIASIVEPVGGVIGYLIIKFLGGSGNLFAGISFSIIAGIMVYVVICEMLILSYKLSKNVTLMTAFFFLGSLMMAFSLVMLSI